MVPLVCRNDQLLNVVSLCGMCIPAIELEYLIGKVNKRNGSHET